VSDAILILQRQAPRRTLAARTLAPEGFSHFVTSMAAPVAGRGLHPLDKRRLVTAHVDSGPSAERSRRRECAKLRTFA
jgi:hypothetical protein